MRALALLSIFAVGLLFSLIGCSSAPVEAHSGHYYYSDGPTPAEKQKLWDSTVAVLGKYFVIRESIMREGVIVATSRVKHHGTRKTRSKVTSKIIQDEEGYFQPMVRVTDQVDISAPRPMNPTGSQPRYEWIRVRNNPNLEARLVNEINHMAYGRKGFDADFFIGPVKTRHIDSVHVEGENETIEIERVREYVIEERIEIEGGGAQNNGRDFENRPIIPDGDEEKIEDPQIKAESSGAEESKTLSKDKEKSTLSK